MKVAANIKYLKISAQKLRLGADMVRGQRAVEGRRAIEGRGAIERGCAVRHEATGACDDRIARDSARGGHVLGVYVGCIHRGDVAGAEIGGPCGNSAEVAVGACDSAGRRGDVAGEGIQSAQLE